MGPATEGEGRNHPIAVPDLFVGCKGGGGGVKAMVRKLCGLAQTQADIRWQPSGARFFVSGGSMS